MNKFALTGTLNRAGKIYRDIVRHNPNFANSTEFRVSPGRLPPLLSKNGGISEAIFGVLCRRMPRSHGTISGFSPVETIFKDGKPLRTLRSFTTSSAKSFIGRTFASRRNYWGTSSSFSSGGSVLGLVVANAAVYISWRVMDVEFMKKNFMISVENLMSGRLHTLITSAFSHVDLGHLFSNMIGLYFFGTSIERLFGSRFLLNLYIAGAISGSVLFVAHKVFMVRNSKDLSAPYWRHMAALGASGAVNAVILLHIFLFPRDVLYLQFIIPVPAMLLGALLIGNDLLRVYQGDSHISGVSHLGGAVIAALAWARIRKRWF
uniref:Rhomboid protein Cabca_PARL n=1 Tax=Cabomba caroliniana TaxID=4426 RepID=A0A0A7E895_CABCA|nr:rhomboid protein Cabca_PARL [Cabomba caroliniana]